MNSRNRLKETTANPCPNSQLPDVNVAEKAAVLAARTPHHPGRKMSPMSHGMLLGSGIPKANTHNIYIYTIYISHYNVCLYYILIYSELVKKM